MLPFQLFWALILAMVGTVQLFIEDLPKMAEAVGRGLRWFDEMRGR